MSPSTTPHSGPGGPADPTGPDPAGPGAAGADPAGPGAAGPYRAAAAASAGRADRAADGGRGVAGAPAIDVDSVAFGYGRDLVLDGMSCTVAAGELVAVAGANGAGKSTLLGVILGLHRPQAGEVRLFGRPPAQLAEPALLGYVPQRRVIDEALPATVGEVVATGLLTRHTWWRRPSPEDQRRWRAQLDVVGLGSRAGDRFRTLSGGQQQRVLIAKALVNDPRLLVLDEPLAGVDAASQELIARVLRERADAGAAVVVVSHELEVLEPVLDRVLLLTQGRIAYDGPLSERELPPHRHGHHF